MQRGRIVGLLSVGICCCTALTALMSGALAAGQKASRVGQTRVVSISPSPVLAAQTHGVRVGKQCTSPRCVGDLLNCFIEIGHSDGYGDTIRVNEAWDAIDPDGDNVRVPAVGNLPIFAVAGNTTCAVGDPLPCLICAGGVACGGNPAISNDPGVVTFQQNQYTILPDDPTILEDQANVRVQDLCDAPGTQGCSMLNNRVQFTAATEIVACCGNNLRESDETCDGTDDAVCNSACRDDCTCCGDGIVQTGEDCDDGNMVNGDGCNTTCLFACGDNDVNQASETCDGSDDATCNLDCRPTGSADPCTCCGDGIVQAGEDCDDANAVNGDGCNNNCVYVCGDNDVNQASEFCDGSDAAVCNTPCRDDCTCCGDGTMQDGEECDDGNLVDGDGCTDCVIDSVCGDNEINQASETCDGTDATVCNRECRTPGGPDECTCCGDGMVNGDEDCDDGNQNNSDGCNTKCFFACGDGAVNQPNETCDGDDAAVCNSPCRASGGADECTCCGDGTMQGGEECDDGNTVDGDGCTDCVIDPRCGDGEVNQTSESCDGSDAQVCNTPCRVNCTCCGDGTMQAGEECDDGNLVDSDGCTDCMIDPRCGDGEVNQISETCDGSDAQVCNTPCRDNCTCCGDGTMQAGEECDDGNMVDGDGCTDCVVDALCGNNVVDQDSETCDGTDDDDCHRACRTPGGPDECTCCGDGVVNADEDCDDGNSVNNDGCNNKCFFACGDGAVNLPHETCDGIDADGCNSACRPAGSADECTCCGDGIVQGGETCDDGNLVDGDGCTDCQLDGFCGNNLVDQDGETCDGTDDKGCHRSCRRPGLFDECTCCGDGIVNGDEDCDDGNAVNHDGCDNKCFYKCGDGAVNLPDETCDGSDDDACSTTCRPADHAFACTCCGDGVVQGDEQCDDGNKLDGDGCSSTCQAAVCGDGIVNGPGETCDGDDFGAAVDGGNVVAHWDDDDDDDDHDGDDDDGDDHDGDEDDDHDGDDDDDDDHDGDDNDDDDGDDHGGPNGRCLTPCRAPGAVSQCTCCGDGIVQGDEQCDDGNSKNDDGCSNTCRLPICGDGKVNRPAETCDGNDFGYSAGGVGIVAHWDGDDDDDDDDDGDDDDDDDGDDDDDHDNDGGCLTPCRAPGTANECTCCGDGIVQAGEECDDGDDYNNDSCSNTCERNPVCGDNVKDGTETCDGTDKAVCNGGCRSPGHSYQCTCCGDGIKQSGEECDDGNKVNGDGCSTQCKREAICGNNDKEGSETCDGYDDSTCNADCRPPGSSNPCTCCGDGIKQSGEECDDGDDDNGDGCSKYCKKEYVCGNNKREGSETCDGYDDSTCNKPCRSPGSSNQCTCCGDGIKQSGEECDDGNDNNGDGCSEHCKKESFCGNNKREGSETCDGYDDSTCNTSCRAPGSSNQCTCCGDGIKQSGEECDDGDNDNGDGCNKYCKKEW